MLRKGFLPSYHSCVELSPSACELLVFLRHLPLVGSTYLFS